MKDRQQLTEVAMRGEVNRALGARLPAVPGRGSGRARARAATRLGAVGCCLTAVLGLAAQAPPPGPAASGTVLRFGFCNSIIEDVNPADALAAVKVWVQTIARPMGGWQSSEAMLYPDSEAAVRAINSNAADVVALPTLDYLANERVIAGEPWMTYMANGEVEVRYVLLARKDVRSVMDVRGRRLAIHSPSSARGVGDTWLDVLLLESGLQERDRTFQQVRLVKKASQAILSLFFNQVEAAVVTRSAFATAVELNPQLGKDLTVLAESPLLLPGVICVRRGLDPELKQRWREAAVRLHENLAARQTFMVMHVARLVPWEPRFLDNSRDLAKKYAQVKRRAATE